MLFCAIDCETSNERYWETQRKYTSAYHTYMLRLSHVEAGSWRLKDCPGSVEKTSVHFDKAVYTYISDTFFKHANFTSESC
jgi:hypothetical protein